MINEGLGYRNFNAFLNRYRIDDAKAALSDPSQRDVQVLTIAMDAGFQSIGPFNRAFKADTGVTGATPSHGCAALHRKATTTLKSANPAEKSTSRILDRARPDLRGRAEKPRIFNRIEASHAQRDRRRPHSGTAARP